MKKILIWFLVLGGVLVFFGCSKEKEYDPMLKEFMTKLVSYSTYEEVGITQTKKHYPIFKDYFTEKGYKAFVKGLYPSIYVEFTTKNKVNRTEDIEIKKIKETVTGDSIILEYHINYTFRGNTMPLKFQDHAQIILVEEDDGYKIDSFILAVPTSDIIQNVFNSYEIR